MTLAAGHPPAGRGTRERIVLDPVEETVLRPDRRCLQRQPRLDGRGAGRADRRPRPTDGIGRVGAGRRIAILGDMLELGPTEPRCMRRSPRIPGLAAMCT